MSKRADKTITTPRKPITESVDPSTIESGDAAKDRPEPALRLDDKSRRLDDKHRSAADRPAAVATEPALRLDDKHRSTLRAARRGAHHRPAAPGDQHLALAAAVPVDGDSLATQLVRELVRSFHVGSAGVPAQVDR